MKPSRRQLARYAADELINKTPLKQLAAHLAAALIAGKKLPELDMLIDDIYYELQTRGQVGKVSLTSAHGLDSKLQKQLVVELRAALDVEAVLLTETTDQSVIGGLRIETSTSSWDSTIATQLNNLKRAV